MLKNGRASQLTVKEYQDAQSTYHIDITSVAMGVTSTQENRTLDWTERDHQDRVFGKVKGKSRLFKKEEFEMIGGESNEEEAAFLRGEKLKDGSSSQFIEEDSVQSFVQNQDPGYGWSAEQIWNFEEIEGKRYYTRRVIGRKAGEASQLIRLVYDYHGPATDEAQAEEDGLAYGGED